MQQSCSFRWYGYTLEYQGEFWIDKPYFLVHFKLHSRRRWTPNLRYLKLSTNIWVGISGDHNICSTFEWL
jgi:hypothetical protein